MRNNSTHNIFPEANHDEQSAQSFIKTLRVFSMRNFHEGNEKILKEKVLKNASSKNKPSRRQMREALQFEPHNQWWSSMMRTTQEMLYDTVGPSIERQLDELIKKSTMLKNKLGSIQLNSSVKTPPYLSAVDMHCKPGSYQQEIAEDDVFAGAEFDRTYRLYSMGGLGPNLDDMGRSLIAWMKEKHSDASPKRILDIGCTVGHSTLPYCDIFPDSEVHAIDVAAPCLRYGHARAVAMNKEVYFSQQNAEKTNFDDNSFDLIVSHAVMHETSHKAIRSIFKECFRILNKGGLMIHMDGIHPDSPLEKYYSEWMAVYNNEPYLGTLQDENFNEICTKAGFSHEKIQLSKALPQFKTKHSGNKPVFSYFIVCAEK